MKPSAPPRRFLHLWLDRLPVDRLRRTSAIGSPFALLAKAKSALRLYALDEAAEREGLAIGMTLADARARLPELEVADADPAADLALLERLTDAGRRYTPAVAVAPPDGIDLDVTGAAPLHGGEAALIEDVRRRFGRLGVAVRQGLADTPGQAFALARHGDAPDVVSPEGRGLESLSPLPIAALRLDPADTATLNHLGLKRIGQLVDLPRAALHRRFGEPLLNRLDEALGRRASPLVLRLEVPPHSAELKLAEPVADEDQVLRLIRRLAARLAEGLEARRLGGRGFRLDLFRVDGAIKRLEVRASRPLADPGRIAALFAERLAGLNEGLEADYGFDLLRLTATGAQSRLPEAQDLLAEPAPAAAFAALADRLAARSGVAVRLIAPEDAHRPEAAVAHPGFAGWPDGAWSGERAPRFEGTPLRPVRMLAPPQPIEVPLALVPEGPPARFHWRRVERTVVRAEGPERIAPEWGRAAPGEDGSEAARDYYRLEDDQGRRYWVFRQGDYGVEAPPRWFLHGLFA